MATAQPLTTPRLHRTALPPLLLVARRNSLVIAGAVLALGFLAIALVPPYLATHDPYAVNVVDQLRPPSRAHLFGTDRLGRDVFSRVVWGTRASLGVAVLSIALAVGIGGTLGYLSGYVGGTADLALGRIMDIIFSFPGVLLAVAITGIRGAGSANAVTAIAIVFTPLFFRVARAPVLAEKGRDYVEAGRAIGAAEPRLLVRHILPNSLTPLIVQASVALCYAILLEAALSYLGLGTVPPTPSWGTVLNEGRQFLQQAPWMSVFPGLAILLAVLAFNLCGDGLRDLLDPRMRGMI